MVSTVFGQLLVANSAPVYQFEDIQELVRTIDFEQCFVEAYGYAQKKAFERHNV